MKKYLLLALLLAAFGLAACGSDESREDADDVLDGSVDKSEPGVIAFNNNYPNIETKCDQFVVGPQETATSGKSGAGHRIFVTTDKQIIVIPDPTCPGWTPETAAGIPASGVGSSVNPGE